MKEHGNTGRHTRITAASHIGDRDENQDSYRVTETPDGRQLVIVCDGLGGETAGREASEAAVAGFEQGWEMLPMIADNRLPQALGIANASVKDRGEIDYKLVGMATTLVGVELGANGAEWISVGDSPLWHVSYNRNDVRQLNKRHNPPGQPYVVTSVLDGRRCNEVDRGTIVPCVGDFLIAASDGLDTLSTDELLETIRDARRNNREQLALALVGAVLDKGKKRQDNVTVVTMERIAPES